MEPVIIGLTPVLVTGLIVATANVLKAFGIADITQQQIDALNQVAGTVMLILAALGTWYARSKVTPVAMPTLPEGTEVKVETPAGESNRTVVV